LYSVPSPSLPWPLPLFFQPIKLNFEFSYFRLFFSRLLCSWRHSVCATCGRVCVCDVRVRCAYNWQTCCRACRWAW
jgi:hypothetical protein